MFRAPAPQCTFFDIAHFKHVRVRYPKYCWWHIWCRIMHVQGATSRVRIFGIVHFKNTHTRYPKKLLVVCWVQRYAHLVRHPNSAHFLALSISKTLIQGSQKHFWWYVWCRGMHVWGATPIMHILWHCPFQKHPYQAFENTFGDAFGVEVCMFRGPHPKMHMFWHCAFQTRPC